MQALLAQDVILCQYSPMRKKQVLKHFGGPVKTAQALGIKHQAVSQWKQIIPWRAAYKVEAITKGALKVNPKDYQ